MPDSKNAAGISTGGSGGLKGMMHNLKEKLHDTHLHDLRAQATHVKHRIGKFENLINPNHRHDEAHEKRTDEKRQRLRDQHRFNSYAPERDGNKIKWYIDGRNYFWVALFEVLVSAETVANPEQQAVSVALERAKDTIYIADWWLSPELVRRAFCPSFTHSRHSSFLVPAKTTVL